MTFSEFMNTYYYIFFIIGGIIFLAALRYLIQGPDCTIEKDLNGKIIIITGSNTGIGKETADRLARHRATIIFACRSKDRTLPVIQEIQEKTGNQNLIFMPLDLNDLKSVRHFAEDFKSRYQKLDILINNAGLSNITFKQSEQGYEQTFAVNHLGHFFLTNLLWELLQNTQNSRIINVASKAHVFSDRLTKERIHNLNNPEIFSNTMTYSRSKLANVLFTNRLQQLIGENVKCVSLHPGTVITEFWRDCMANCLIRILIYLVYPIIWFFFKTSVKGAQTTIYCAMENFDRLTAGAYYNRLKVTSKSGNAEQIEDSQELWEFSKNLTAQF